MTRIDKGIELLQEETGSGPVADRGTTVTYCARMFLRRGDEVTFDRDSIALYGDRLSTRIIDGVELIEHETELGRRRAIAGVEKSLLGMRPGGYREVVVSPHLGYGGRGVPGRIPADALLRVRLWLLSVRSSSDDA